MQQASDSAVRKLTAEILARPEFTRTPPHDPLWAEWARRFLHWLQQIQALHDSDPWLYWMVFAGAIVTSVALMAHVVWSIWIAMSEPEPLTGRASGKPLMPDLETEARALADSGNFLEAAHCLMIASFHALADESVIQLRPDRSNRWIRTALQVSGLNRRIADEIDDLIAGTERRWFGGRENDPEIYSRWVDAFARLTAELR